VQARNGRSETNQVDSNDRQFVPGCAEENFPERFARPLDLYQDPAEVVGIKKKIKTPKKKRINI